MEQLTYESILYERYKGCYAIAAWGEMLKMGTGCYSASEIPNIYVAAGKDPCGKTLTALTCYTDNPDAVPKSFMAELLGIGEVCALCLLDEEHNFDRIAEYYPDKEQIHITIKPNTVIVIA